MKLLTPFDPFEPGSPNLRVAKIAAMLLVVTGHYYKGYWSIPVTCGVWIFAFSSGLFSGASFRYETGYWDYLRPKVQRLLIPLATAQVVVIGVCLLRGYTDLLNLFNLFAVFGLTRFANWIGIEFMVPLGNGLWFLNLLWIFYLVLPLMVPLLRHRVGAWLVCGLGFAGAVILENRCWQGVFFFSTAFAFLLGAAVGVQRKWFTRGGLIVALVICTGVVLGYYLIEGTNMLDTTWLMVISLIAYHLLLRVKFPLITVSPSLAKFDTMLLPVYITHTYFFIGQGAASPIIKFAFFGLSFTMTLAVSWLLARVNTRLH